MNFTACLTILSTIFPPISGLAAFGSLRHQIPLLESSRLAPPFFVSEGVPNNALQKHLEESKGARGGTEALTRG